MEGIKVTITVIGGAIAYAVGGWSILLTTLLILNAFDYLSGWMANLGNISSKIGFRGVIKKGMMWVWIVVANLVYLVLQHMGYDFGEVIPNAVALSFIVNELVSLGENSIKLGIAVPVPVQKALAIFTEKNEKTEGK